MWLFSASRICARVGSGWRSRRCFAATTMPGMQKPHWSPPAVAKAWAKMCRSRGAKPSSVTTCLPATLPAAMTQDESARPSTSTVQEPQDPCGAQPFFGEIRPACSRSTSISDVWASICAVKGAPLSVNVTGEAVPSAFTASLQEWRVDEVHAGAGDEGAEQQAQRHGGGQVDEDRDAGFGT